MRSLDPHGVLINDAEGEVGREKLGVVLAARLACVYYDRSTTSSWQGLLAMSEEHR